MGNSSFTLVIRLEGEPAFASGDTITGRVYLSVNKPEGIPCDALNILFHGKESARIHYTELKKVGIVQNKNHECCHHNRDRRRNHELDVQTQTYFEHNDSIVINLDVPLYRPMHGRFMPGQYEFPFQFTLPNNMPPTMKCESGGSQCQVNYQISAYLYKKQSSRSRTFNPLRKLNNKVTSQEVNVTIAGNIHAVTPPMQEPYYYFPPESCDIRNCCKRMGHIELNAKMESRLLEVNKFQPRTHCVFLDLRNYSKIDVKSIKMELVECTTWRVGLRDKISKVTLSQKSLDTAGFDTWERFNENQLSYVGKSEMERPLMHDRAMDVTAEDPQRPSLPTKLMFKIPNEARESFEGNLIEVTHFIRVTANTSRWCTTNPEVSADVQIFRPPPSPPLRNGRENEMMNVNLIAGSDRHDNQLSSEYDLSSSGSPAPRHEMGFTGQDSIALPDGWTPQTIELVTLN